MNSLESRCEDGISETKIAVTGNFKHVDTSPDKNVPDGQIKTKIQNTVLRKGRLLLPGGEASTEGIIAFYAYMSAPTPSPGTHQTLIFDVAKTNVGHGYNLVTGVFTAPGDGVYVFVWVIRMTSAEHPTELMVNNAVYGTTFLRAKGGDDGSVSGTVVAQLHQGDVVFVCIHSNYSGDGSVHSNQHGHPSFSGWLLH